MLSCTLRIAIKYEKWGLYAAFLLIIWIKPRVTHHCAIRFQIVRIVSPAKPKKLSNECWPIFAQICSTSQNFLASLRVHETQLLHYTKYSILLDFFGKILAELILNLYDHSMRVIWSFSKVESSDSERNKIQLGTENNWDYINSNRLFYTNTSNVLRNSPDKNSPINLVFFQSKYGYFRRL